MEGRVEGRRPGIGILLLGQGVASPNQGSGAFSEIARWVGRVRGDTGVQEGLKVLCSGRQGKLGRSAELAECDSGGGALLGHVVLV